METIMKEAKAMRLNKEEIKELVRIGPGDSGVVLSLLSDDSKTLTFKEAVAAVEEYPF